MLGRMPIRFESMWANYKFLYAASTNVLFKSSRGIMQVRKDQVVLAEILKPSLRKLRFRDEERREIQIVERECRICAQLSELPVGNEVDGTKAPLESANDRQR